MFVFLSKVIYGLMTFFITGILNSLASEGCSFTLRNSVAHGYAKFPFSDIDLSLFATSCTSEQNIQHSIRCWHRLSIFVPFLCELNIYKVDELDSLGNVFNFFETKRDKHLFKVLDFDNQKIENSTISITIFLLHMIYSNLGLDDKILGRRRQKWMFYLDICDLNSHVSSVDDLVVEMNSVLADSAVKINLNDLSFGSGVIKMKPFLSLTKWLELGFMSKLGSEWSIADLSKLNHDERELVLEQVKWEVSGLYSQFRLEEDRSCYNEHLCNLKTVVSSLSLGAKSAHIIDSISTLMKIIQSSSS